MIYIHPQWEGLDRSNWEDIGSTQIDTYRSNHPESSLLFFGHSFGAALAMVQAEKWNPVKIIACSPSPIFEGDLDRLPPFRHFIIRSFIPDDFTPHPYPNHLSEQLVFFYGRCDSPLISRRNIAYRCQRYKDSETIIIQEATHRLAGKKYLQVVITYIGEMEL